MADAGTLHWSSDGRPFLLDASGSKYFVPPIVAAQYVNDPKALAWAKSQGASIGAPGGTDTVTGRPGASLFTTAGTWNPDAGKYDQGVNWENIAALAAGGFAGAGAGEWTGSKQRRGHSAART